MNNPATALIPAAYILVTLAVAGVLLFGLGMAHRAFVGRLPEALGWLVIPLMIAIAAGVLSAAIFVLSILT